MYPTPDNLRLVPLAAEGKRSPLVPELADADTLTRLEGYISRGLQHQLTDFDAHLDDSSRDWFNTKLLLG